MGRAFSLPKLSLRPCLAIAIIVCLLLLFGLLDSSWAGAKILSLAIDRYNVNTIYAVVRMYIKALMGAVAGSLLVY